MAKNLGSLIRKPLTKRDLSVFYQHVGNDSSDRSVALVLGAYVERWMEDAIKSRLIKLTASEYRELFESGPLRSIESKIKMCRALGIIGKRGAGNLTRMKVIRNAFAHAVHQISFSTKGIRQKCLSIGQNEPGFAPYFNMTLNGAMLNLSRPRDRYIYASMVYSMLMRAHTAKSFTRRPKRIHGGAFSVFY